MTPLVRVSLKYYPLTPRRWRDIEVLFGERGACGGCWCMAWRLPAKIWRAGKGTRNKRALKGLVSGGDAPGIVGYLGRKPIAWCAVAPREAYRFLQHSRVLSPVDDQLVWSISCMFVLKPYRRRGLLVQLLRAAVKFATERGAKIVEGYPTVPYDTVMPGPFLWMGVPSAFKQVGFVEVARRSKSPIMRYAC